MPITQPANTCSKSSKERLEKGVKYLQNWKLRYKNHVTDVVNVVLVSLLLASNIFHFISLNSVSIADFKQVNVRWESSDDIRFGKIFMTRELCKGVVFSMISKWRNSIYMLINKSILSYYKLWESSWILYNVKKIFGETWHERLNCIMCYIFLKLQNFSTI